MTDAEREATIGRIAARLRAFDDHTLRELDRLTDPETHRAAAGTGRDGPVVEGPVVDETPLALTRRQLLAGLVAGGGLITASALGTAWVARQQAAAVCRTAGGER